MFLVRKTSPYATDVKAYLDYLKLPIWGENKDGYLIDLSPWEYHKLKGPHIGENDEIVYTYDDTGLSFYAVSAKSKLLKGD